MKGTPSRRQPTRWTLTDAAALRPSGIRQNLVPRTIYFPPGWLARIESRGPGALNELITLALAEFTSKGGV